MESAVYSFDFIAAKTRQFKLALINCIEACISRLWQFIKNVISCGTHDIQCVLALFDTYTHRLPGTQVECALLFSRAFRPFSVTHTSVDFYS